MSRSLVIDLMHVAIIATGIAYIVKNKQDFKNTVVQPIKKILQACENMNSSNSSN